MALDNPRDLPLGGPKRPGKTKWAGRRRPVTRRSGFSARSPVYIAERTVNGVLLQGGERLTIEITIPATSLHDRVGFGGWYYASHHIGVTINGCPEPYVLTTYPDPNWNKFGSQWTSDPDIEYTIEVAFLAHEPTLLALFQVDAGIIKHDHLDSARPQLLANMWSYAPEGNFYVVPGRVDQISPSDILSTPAPTLYLKSCNRCGRFLPINLQNERDHLSFSNHCVAFHRQPCVHSNFGRIRAPNGEREYNLRYGFQLECRFCKKFEVNAAHNPRRTVAQMKEDAQRRRYLELLLEQLYQGSSHLQYRHVTGAELTTDTFRRFDGRCFKCKATFRSEKDMHLDHTRPLALFWPLDETATALCATCNAQKRDRPPADFYSPTELEDLAQKTGLSIEVLTDPSPNIMALCELRNKADWFFNDFLQRPELQEPHDGKRPADLILDAVDKALDKWPGGAPFRMRDLQP